MSDRAALKTYFETGDYPSQAQFEDLIDSLALTGELAALAAPSNFTTMTTEVITGHCEILCSDGITRKFAVLE